MTREEIQKAVLDIPNSNILIMAGTGIGKTFCALSKIDKIKPKGKILLECILRAVFNISSLSILN